MDIDKKPRPSLINGLLATLPHLTPKKFNRHPGRLLDRLRYVDTFLTQIHHSALYVFTQTGGQLTPERIVTVKKIMICFLVIYSACKIPILEGGQMPRN